MCSEPSKKWLVLQHAQAQTARRPEDLLPPRYISATSTQTVNLCSSARTYRRQSPAQPKNWFVRRRGDAEVFRLGRTKRFQTLFGSKTKQSPARHPAVQEPSPRLRVNQFFVLRSQATTSDLVHAKAQRREDVVFRLASICLRRLPKSRDRLIVHVGVASPSRLCAFA
jgi:hypothetical protein